MTKTRTTNRDHAKKKQRPMIEDEVIAQQLEALLTPAMLNQKNSYRQLGRARPHSQLAPDDGCGVNLTMARCSRGKRTD